MSNAEQDLKNIEISIDQAKQLLARKEAMLRLEKNADFKLLITEDYLKENVLRLVRLKASPQFQDPIQQADIVKQLDAVGCLGQFLRYVFIQGTQAETALAQDIEERDSILAESAV